MPKMFLKVALHCPLDEPLDYLPPEHHAIQACPIGARVLVPFGRTQKIGVILRHTKETTLCEEKIRRVIRVLDPQPLFSREDLAFLHWVAGYYHYPIGEVVLLALPLRLRKKEAHLLVSEPFYRLVTTLPVALNQLNRAPRQQALVKAIAAAGDEGCSSHILRTQFDDFHGVLRRLQAKQIVEMLEQAPIRDAVHWKDAPYLLNTEQVAAIQAIKKVWAQFTAFLLEGVTGSGKTEVYLQVVKQVLHQGKNVLFLVPEISLTPQLAQSLRERLGSCVVVMHSGLSQSEQEIAWHKVRLGLSRLVIGTRSLIFYPIVKLGLIIVDEEHDVSFKQQEGLRYSARDLAIIRAKRANCPIILGSATPSLETLRNAKCGRYQHLKLIQRTGDAKSPPIRLLDIRDQPLQAGITDPLLQMMQAILSRGQQVLVFINRRGYAPVLSCYRCGWLSSCHHCDAHPTVHYADNILSCHHCGAQYALPKVCPSCGSHELQPLGQGTEKVESFLQRYFSNTPLLRIDKDTTTRKNRLNELINQVHQLDAAILVGTQILAKGHHFPKVTLVCILDADSGLFSVDFRATERMTQLLLQVAGRAGRGSDPGQVILQTRYPDHPLLQVLVQSGYAAFAEMALSERMQANYPPFTYQVLIRAESKKAEYAEAFLQTAATWLTQQKKLPMDYWGPVSAPMARRAGKYRCHLLMQAKKRDVLHNTLRKLHTYLQSSPLKHRINWSMDIDPYESY